MPLSLPTASWPTLSETWKERLRALPVGFVIAAAVLAVTWALSTDFGRRPGARPSTGAAAGSGSGPGTGMTAAAGSAERSAREMPPPPQQQQPAAFQLINVTSCSGGVTYQDLDSLKGKVLNGFNMVGASLQTVAGEIGELKSRVAVLEAAKAPPAPSTAPTTTSPSAAKPIPPPVKPAVPQQTPKARKVPTAGIAPVSAAVPVPSPPQEQPPATQDGWTIITKLFTPKQ